MVCALRFHREGAGFGDAYYRCLEPSPVIKTQVSYKLASNLWEEKSITNIWAFNKK